MFTGIVEEVGEVVALEASRGGARLALIARAIGAETRIGESVAVNGCCLTAAGRSGDSSTPVASGLLEFDLLQETLACTNLGALVPGSQVNLERSMAANGRFGGHFVQGHIDGTAAIQSLSQHGADHRLEIELPPEFAHHVVLKGSIAIDGISLTVAELSENSFVVWLIPHTVRATNVSSRRTGESVNLEFDLLGKYVDRLLRARGIL